MKKSSGRAIMAMFLAPAFLFCCARGVEIPERAKSTADLPSSARYGKELEEIRNKIRNDIRIKLKKDGKGNYGWEITGRDPYEVVKANNIIRSRLNSDRRE